jgi:DNA-binding MarR family transcriptional regulator
VINLKYGLDPIQIKVLNEIIFSLSQQKEISVGLVLTLTEIASRATLHAALKKLISNNIISLRLINENRTKFIELTPLGEQRYKELANSYAK